MLLFLDTETTDLVDYRLPVDHPSQPHICQLAAYLATDDDDATHVRSLNAVIRPRGWRVSTGAERVHHLTHDYLLAFGEELEDVLDRLFSLLVDTIDLDREPGGLLIGHNLEFDTRMLLRDIAFSDLGVIIKRDLVSSLSTPRPFCTMRSMTNIVKSPGRFPGKYKWPKLEEAYEFMFSRKPPADAAHSAMGDVLSCKDIFVEGRRREYWR